MTEDLLVLYVTGAGAPRPPVVVVPVPCRLGRGPDVEVVLDDAKVSKRHARIEWRDAEPVLVDDGSFNGVWVGEQRVQARPLDGDVEVRLGGTRLRCIGRSAPASRVLSVEVPGAAETRRVVRLPCVVGIDVDGELSLLPDEIRVDAAVLMADARGVYLWIPRPDGEIEERRPAEDGALELGGLILRETAMRDFSVLPTDLTFDGGDLQPRFSLSSVEDDFPPEGFERAEVDVAALATSGLPVHESRFLALGGGLGSFCWVDVLRVHGVRLRDIRVVGFEAVPYARYARLCAHSQIPLHERLRSNSESCPDNVWGFPGYGPREAFAELGRLRLAASARILWQLTAEPDLTATYTPRAGDVFRSIDREARRIGWGSMLHTGRIRGVRKTTDGRYAVAVSSRADPEAPRAIYVADFVHLALGYPGVQFLPDLRTYREQTRDTERVVNAYEDHDHVYERLEAVGGTVLLRGRGIVASRVLQRLAEVRAKNPDVTVVHLMRSRRRAGNRFGGARRRVENHWELQPFNWPEACWGGDLQGRLAAASGDRRADMLRAWGGTTTAPRADWLAIVEHGLRRGWYRVVFGTVAGLSGEGDRLDVRVAAEASSEDLAVDFVIDATGLVSSVQANPVLADLVERYDLPLNVRGGLDVDGTFEVRALRNGSGRAFAAGVSTLGGPYAPVDSFLGLQFGAFATLDALWPRVRPLSPARSLGQWMRWVGGVAP